MLCAEKAFGINLQVGGNCDKGGYFKYLFPTLEHIFTSFVWIDHVIFEHGDMVTSQHLQSILYRRSIILSVNKTVCTCVCARVMYFDE